MKTYTYLDVVSNEVGRVHWVSLHLQANSVEEAERICEEHGWKYDGKLIETIPAPEMEDYCKGVQEQRDREWLEGQP